MYCPVYYNELRWFTQSQSWKRCCRLFFWWWLSLRHSDTPTQAHRWLVWAHFQAEFWDLWNVLEPPFLIHCALPHCHDIWNSISQRVFLGLDVLSKYPSESIWLTTCGLDISWQLPENKAELLKELQPFRTLLKVMRRGMEWKLGINISVLQFCCSSSHVCSHMRILFLSKKRIVTWLELWEFPY